MLANENINGAYKIVNKVLCNQLCVFVALNIPIIVFFSYFNRTIAMLSHFT